MSSWWCHVCQVGFLDMSSRRGDRADSEVPLCPRCHQDFVELLSEEEAEGRQQQQPQRENPMEDAFSGVRLFQLGAGDTPEELGRFVSSLLGAQVHARNVHSNHQPHHSHPHDNSGADNHEEQEDDAMFVPSPFGFVRVPRPSQPPIHQSPIRSQQNHAPFHHLHRQNIHSSPDTNMQSDPDNARQTPNFISMVQDALTQLFPDIRHAVHQPQQPPSPNPTGPTNSESPGHATNESPQHQNRRQARIQRTMFPGGMAITMNFSSGGGMPTDEQHAPPNTEHVDIGAFLQFLFQQRPGDVIQGDMPPMFAPFFQMAGNAGDYVFNQQGLDAIISQLMEQTAGRNAPPPAPEEALAKLPQRQISNEELERTGDCPICQDNFSSDTVIIPLPCHHVFHPDCILPWLRTNGTCPICRHNIAETATSSESPAQTPPEAVDVPMEELD